MASLAAGDGNAALFTALREGTLEAYEKEEEERMANALG